MKTRSQASSVVRKIEETLAGEFAYAFSGAHARSSFVRSSLRERERDDAPPTLSQQAAVQKAVGPSVTQSLRPSVQVNPTVRRNYVQPVFYLASFVDIDRPFKLIRPFLATSCSPSFILH